MHKKIVITGAMFSMVAVILGAMNAHYLKQFFTEELTASFDTGVRYQMYHGLFLICLGLMANSINLKRLNQLGILFSIGIALFSFSIYVLCAFKSNGLIGLTGLGILTPIGGLVLIYGWLYFIFIVVKSHK